MMVPFAICQVASEAGTPILIRAWPTSYASPVLDFLVMMPPAFPGGPGRVELVTIDFAEGLANCIPGVLILHPGQPNAQVLSIETQVAIRDWLLYVAPQLNRIN